MNKKMATLALLFGLLPLQGACAQPEPLALAIKSDFRTPANKTRDVSRHPQQTLTFFELKPTDTVVELWPGGGWYSEILGPYLAKQGKFIAAGFEPSPSDPASRSPFYAKSAKRYQAWLTDNADTLGAASYVVLDPPHKLTLAPDNSVDKVLTFRNLHNWMIKQQLEAVFIASYNALKPGGIFGVVEHRGLAAQDPKTGYVDPKFVIGLAERVGFTLVASSEINANPKDTRAHPNGVWTLPPRLKVPEGQSTAPYLAIGESDRMTLKFIKP